MTNYNSNTVTIPRSAIREKEGIVVLSFRQWKKIEEGLEDLEMYHSRNLSREIDERRKEKKAVSLTKLLKKYHI